MQRALGQCPAQQYVTAAGGSRRLRARRSPVAGARRQAAHCEAGVRPGARLPDRLVVVRADLQCSATAAPSRWGPRSRRPSATSPAGAIHGLPWARGRVASAFQWGGSRHFGHGGEISLVPWPARVRPRFSGTAWAEPRAGGTPTPGASAPSVAAPQRAQNNIHSRLCVITLVHTQLERRPLLFIYFRYLCTLPRT